MLLRYKDVKNNLFMTFKVAVLYTHTGILKV